MKYIAEDGRIFIEKKCVEYNEMVDDYLNCYPDNGAIEILEMLRRAKLRGRNKTTGETD